jgi:hypothetical protein
MERQALEIALSNSNARDQRYCRMTASDNGLEQICDGPIEHQRGIKVSEADAVLKPRIVITHGEPCAMRARSAFPNAIAIIARTMTEGT